MWPTQQCGPATTASGSCLHEIYRYRSSSRQHRGSISQPKQTTHRTDTHRQTTAGTAPVSLQPCEIYCLFILQKKTLHHTPNNECVIVYTRAESYTRAPASRIIQLTHTKYSHDIHRTRSTHHLPVHHEFECTQRSTVHHNPPPVH